MTNRKAIEILGLYDVSDLHFYTTDGEEIPFTEWSDALELAISTLNKQIPKQPMVITDGCDNSFWHLYCPTCGAAVGVYSKRLKNTAMYNSTNCKICAQCGQTFDLELQEGE